MQLFSYHTHTNFSDGKNSIKEMIEQAVSLGWKELGISDHLIVHKNIPNSQSWPRWKKEPNIYYWDFNSIYEKFARHIEEIRKISANFPIKVRVGAEVDFFTYDGWLDEFTKLREKLDFDYCISGNHYLFLDDAGENIIEFKDSELLPLDKQINMIRQHFKIICRAASSGLFDFIAHIDYIRKMPIYNTTDFSNEKAELIKTLAAHNVATEISTKGLRKSDYFYPDSDMLKNAIKNNVKIVISDDAHRTNELGYRFDYAEDTLRQYDCTSRWNFIEK